MTNPDSSENESFVQRSLRVQLAEGKLSREQILDNIISGNAGLLADVGRDHTIWTGGIPLATRTLDEAIALRYGYINPEQITKFRGIVVLDANRRQSTPSPRH